MCVKRVHIYIFVMQMKCYSLHGYRNGTKFKLFIAVNVTYRTTTLSLVTKLKSGFVSVLNSEILLKLLTQCFSRGVDGIPLLHCIRETKDYVDMVI